MKKIIKIFVIIFILLILALVILNSKLEINFIKKINGELAKNEVIDDFKIHTYTYDTNNSKAVLVDISRASGIASVTYATEDNKEIVLNCNNKQEITLDVAPPKNVRQYYTVKDSNGNTSVESFIAPDTNIALTTNKDTITDIKLDGFDTSLTDKLDDKLVSSANMTITVRQAVYQDTNSTDASEIFNSWTKYPNLSTVGSANYNANWSLSGNTIRTNADVSWTGYWDKNASDYDQDITLSFDSYSGDNTWGDPIGFTFRMTEPSTNVYSFYALELDHEYKKITLARITKWDPANQNMSLHCGPLYDMSLHNCTGSILSTVSYNLPTSTWLSTKIQIAGNTISVYMGSTKVIEITESDTNMLKKGGYGPYVASNPYAYFRNVAISTNKSMTLDDIIASNTWDANKINVLVNVNTNTETALSSDSTAQLFNNNNIYYVGVGGDTNKSEIQTFINKIRDGIFVNNADALDSKYTQIANFISSQINS